MSELNNNFPLNILPQGGGKKNKAAKENINKLTQNSPEKLINQTQKEITTLNQSSLSSNTKVTGNQKLQTNPALNQTALNKSSLAETNINNQNLKRDVENQLLQTPSQAEFHGPRDLPSYSGIANMSLKSWISSQENKSFTNFEGQEKQLAVTLDGIKGFQRKNYKGLKDDSSLKGENKFKKLLILSQLFSLRGQSGINETELAISINTFKKLGSALKDKSGSNEEEILDEYRLSPPMPEEIQKIENLDSSKIKHIQKLFALPDEFPECIRLFAKDEIEINEKELSSFFKQRVKLVQDLIISGDSFLKNEITKFIPLLNQNDYSVLLPLIMLYYPLPLPLIKTDYDFLNVWKKKKKDSDENIIASCEIYYLSKKRGRFLLKFELNDKDELSFNVKTAMINNGIVKDLEQAVSESMILLNSPPDLSELNVLLTEEIYKATDIDEELSMVSTGPLRLEIVLAVYAALVVLNKLNEEPDPGGLIDMTP